MQIEIGNIKIMYASNQQPYIERIKKIIQNNYELIFSYLNEGKTIDISDDESNFDDMFYRIVSEVYTDDNMKRAFSDEDFLSALHIEALIRRKNILVLLLLSKMLI